MQELWTEKYRPKELDEYVFKDEKQKEQIEKWLKEGSIPHLLFSGNPGSGKSALAYLLVEKLGIDRADFMEINASQENSVETIREKIVNFCTTLPMNFDGFKIVLLDEGDYLTPNAQAVLRGILPKYADITRFILTANYANKIIPALHSRCQGFKFDALDKNNFAMKIGEILAQEGVEFDLETLDDYVNMTHPDLRKCINYIQQYSSSGKLLPLNQIDGGSNQDYLIDMTRLFKEGNILEARKLVTSQAQPEEYPEIYRYFYENLQFWGDSDETQNQALLIIAKRLRDHALVADPEINLAACMVELNELVNG